MEEAILNTEPMSSFGGGGTIARRPGGKSLEIEILQAEIQALHLAGRHFDSRLQHRQIAGQAGAQSVGTGREVLDLKMTESVGGDSLNHSRVERSLQHGNQHASERRSPRVLDETGDVPAVVLSRRLGVQHPSDQQGHE